MEDDCGTLTGDRERVGTTSKPKRVHSSQHAWPSHLVLPGWEAGLVPLVRINNLQLTT